MSSYLYEAVDGSGLKSQGLLAVTDQSEALKRIKEMGLFPIRVWQAAAMQTGARPLAGRKPFRLPAWMTDRSIKPAALAVFTRQLATLSDVGMPLLRGLRLLHEQEENRTMRRVITEVARTVETGGTLSEALAAHPKVFNRLYVNMVKAGETGGILELVLRRQAEFMEKALKIRGKVKAAMFYPMAVMLVAAGIITLLLTFIIPRFQSVFDGLLNGRPMPPFTLAVLHVSDVFKSHFVTAGLAVLALVAAFQLLIHTRPGRRWFDHFKLVAIDPRKVMVILVLGQGLIKEELVLLDGPVQLKEVSKIAQLLNSRFSGWTLAEIRNALLKEAETVKKTKLSIIETALKLIEGALHFDPQAIHLEGATHLMEQPEFRNSEKMEQLLRLVEQKGPLAQVLGRQWTTPGLTVSIGHEFPEAFMRDFSFVHIPYYFQGKVIGAVGVLGPTRMAYDRVAGVVNHLARQLETNLTKRGG